LWAESRGKRRTTAAAPTPPRPRTAKPARTAREFPGNAAAVVASGESAAASINPRVRSERQMPRTEDPAAGIPAHDRDPDHLIEAARKRDAHDRGATARGGERKRARSLVRPEEATPPVRLEAIRDREENARGGDKAGIPVRERPAGVDK
jgi:hypothetical protein